MTLTDAQTITLDIELADLPVVGTVKFQRDACAPIDLSYPVVGSFKFSGLACPLAANQAMSIKTQMDLSYFIPDGVYKTKVVAKNQRGEQMMCLQTTLSLGVNGLPRTVPSFGLRQIPQIPQITPPQVQEILGAIGKAPTDNRRIDLAQIQQDLTQILGQLKDLSIEGAETTTGAQIQQDVIQILAQLKNLGAGMNIKAVETTMDTLSDMRTELKEAEVAACVRQSCARFGVVLSLCQTSDFRCP